jgi:hypothetical protein
VALLVGRTLMVLLALALVLLGGRGAYLAAVRGTGPGKNAVKPGEDVQPRDPRLLQAYPGRDIDEIEAIRQATRDAMPADPTAPPRGSFESRHVNLGPEGYRVTPGRDTEGARPVFLFGGSTMWGYNLPDDETIAAHLQRRLDAGDGAAWRVRNYGVCASYSKFERQLFESLLAGGARPAAVVFIDGLNEFCRLPLNRPREDGFRGGEGDPAGRRESPLLAWLTGRPATAQRRPRKGELRPYTAEDIRRAATELVMNWRMIHAVCDRFGIPCLLILQPIPVYGRSLDDHLFLTEAQLHGDRSYYLAARSGYELLAAERMLADVPHADLHRLTVDGPGYVDTCHYSSAFSDRLAGEIARWISEQAARAPAP